MSDTDPISDGGDDRPREGETVPLTDEQKQRARAALRAVQEGVATTPHDLLDEWVAPPDSYELKSMSDADDEDFSEHTEKWVPVSSIKGIDRDLRDEFMEGRMKSALEMFADERFQPKHTESPYYMEVCGDFYVSMDGSHRSMASKVVGIEEIYANVDVVDVNESEYQEWVDRRHRDRPTSSTSDATEATPDGATDDRGLIQRLSEWIRR